MSARSPKAALWKLKEAKARFSELVRLARADGPQRVTIHGRDSVVVVSTETFDAWQHASAGLTGQTLVDAFRDSRARDLALESARDVLPVREPVTFD